MAPETKRRKPAITVTRSEHARLSRLAESHASRNPDVADELLAELDGELGRERDRFGVVAVHVEDRGLDHLEDVGAVQ